MLRYMPRISCAQKVPPKCASYSRHVSKFSLLKKAPAERSGSAEAPPPGERLPSQLCAALPSVKIIAKKNLL